VTAAVLDVRAVERVPDAMRGHDGDYIARTPHLRWWPVGTLWERLADRGR
jgi:hypothetical protein